MPLMLRTHRSAYSAWLLVAFCAILGLALLPRAAAFGAGNIPSYSHQEGKAFRHGDLADTLSALLKKSGGGLFSGKSKWGGLDIKRVYFGNWLRDYSQAMDVAGLEKLSKQTILSIVMVLSFLAHGYATGEFEVTEERLGVYLPTEHLDNPKGYPSNAKQFDHRLRGPVDPQELEIDPRSGMKNYLANESGGWATSSRLIRETVSQVVQLGREARKTGRKETLHDAYRHLGKAMHCLEDFPAHSNFCELALLKLGHRQVFCHVGDNVRVRSPSGEMVPCLVTGSFGGMDFVASMLGETSDHLSSASVSDLSKTIDDAKQKQNQGGALNSLMSVLGKLPTSVGGDVTRDAEVLSRGPAADPGTMSPQEIYSGLFKIFTFHDKVMMGVESTIEKIPGLENLLETIGNSLSTFTMTLIEPFVKPLISSALNGLQATSGAVVSGVDQYEVFNDPSASDPTHTQLAKDHFNLILNEVAGNVAIIIDRHVVNTIVASWDDNRDPQQVADECLAPMFHPFWQHPRSTVQAEMLDYVAAWARNHTSDIQRLSKEHCRAHTNTRSGKAETHSGCGGGSVTGAAQQDVGFGPAMASWVGGKVGLPTAGSTNSTPYGSLIGRDTQTEGLAESRTAAQSLGTPGTPYIDSGRSHDTAPLESESTHHGQEYGAPHQAVPGYDRAQGHSRPQRQDHGHPQEHSAHHQQGHDYDREHSRPHQQHGRPHHDEPRRYDGAETSQGWGAAPQSEGYGQAPPYHPGGPSYGAGQAGRYDGQQGGTYGAERPFEPYPGGSQGPWAGGFPGDRPPPPPFLMSEQGGYGGPPSGQGYNPGDQPFPGQQQPYGRY
ncbi:Het-C-domain-containing protein [Microstroma glucosiphilum]|uniref:Het-C-domain-containing protein n=1 Tax=Pseudomicrostroma glucosiphilum TaxID=1684307 RepID=A0A316U0S8_9BASI|nr:Het-C-domain-containing protein [Pseudomicrostroma glucosiphilum]PWN19006.1 Het-C-domain-containing protein [Pseudomicrostroma glucosiphilum]